jgi:hypothetical protein
MLDPTPTPPAKRTKLSQNLGEETHCSFGICLTRATLQLTAGGGHDRVHMRNLS